MVIDYSNAKRAVIRSRDRGWTRLRLPEDIVAWIAETAAASKISESEVVEVVIRDYVARHRR